MSQSQSDRAKRSNVRVLPLNSAFGPDYARKIAETCVHESQNSLARRIPGELEKAKSTAKLDLWQMIFCRRPNTLSEVAKYWRNVINIRAPDAHVYRRNDNARVSGNFSVCLWTMTGIGNSNDRKYDKHEIYLIVLPIFNLIYSLYTDCSKTIRIYFNDRYYSEIWLCV